MAAPVILQPRNRMSSGLAAVKVLEEGIDSLLCGLMGAEARPLEIAALQTASRVLKIPLRLAHPIGCP
jgi:hypothetical protein